MMKQLNNVQSQKRYPSQIVEVLISIHLDAVLMNGEHMIGDKHWFVCQIFDFYHHVETFTTNRCNFIDCLYSHLASVQQHRIVGTHLAVWNCYGGRIIMLLINKKTIQISRPTIQYITHILQSIVIINCVLNPIIYSPFYMKRWTSCKYFSAIIWGFQLIGKAFTLIFCYCCRVEDNFWNFYILQQFIVCYTKFVEINRTKVQISDFEKLVMSEIPALQTLNHSKVGITGITGMKTFLWNIRNDIFAELSWKSIEFFKF